MPLSAGDKLGPYEILGPIGAGGIADSWLGRSRVTELVAGETLAALVKSPPPIETALDYSKQIGEALRPRMKKESSIAI